MHHARDFRLTLQPAREFDARLVVARQAHAQRAKPAQGEIQVVGSGRSAQIVDRGPDLFVDRLIADGDQAQHDVRMPADVFRAGLHAHVHAVIERPEIDRRGPRVVHRGGHTLGLARRHDRRHVLHLEGHRARRFEHAQNRVGPDQGGDAGTDGRIVIGRLDAVALEHGVAIAARGRVGRIDAKDVIARFGEGHQRAQNRRRARAHGEGGIAALQLRDRVLEREGRGRTVAPVAHLVLGLGFLRGLERFERREQNRRRMVNGRIDDAEIRFRIAAEGGQFRVGLHFGGVSQTEGRGGCSHYNKHSRRAQPNPRTGTNPFAGCWRPC